MCPQVLIVYFKKYLSFNIHNVNFFQVPSGYNKQSSSPLPSGNISNMSFVPLIPLLQTNVSANASSIQPPLNLMTPDAFRFILYNFSFIYFQDLNNYSIFAVLQSEMKKIHR